jgi:hypothetical protein
LADEAEETASEISVPEVTLESSSASASRSSRRRISALRFGS